MQQVTNLCLMLAGCVAGAALLTALRRHEHRFERFFCREMETSALVGVEDVCGAEWYFGVCACGMTREAIGVMHSDKRIEVLPCFGSDLED